MTASFFSTRASHRRYCFSRCPADTANVQFALGEWNLYVRFPQCLREAHRHVAFEPEPIFLVSPETKLTVERIIAKTHEVGLRLGISCHSGMYCCHFDQ